MRKCDKLNHLILPKTESGFAKKELSLSFGVSSYFYS